jgi:hypothetical protein
MRQSSAMENVEEPADRVKEVLPEPGRHAGRSEAGVRDDTASGFVWSAVNG